MRSFNFSHFFGRGAVSRLDDDTPDKPEDEPNDPQGNARGRRVEEPDKQDDDTNAEDPDNPEDPDKQGKKGKKARARARRAENDPDEPDAEGDEDDGDDKVDDPADKEARMAERHRCARIFSCPHAAANPALAASLAFNTGMSSAAAIQVMASSGTAVSPSAGPRRPSLDERMRDENIPGLKQESPKASGLSALVSQYKQLKGK